jgi:hypothetical protein
LTCWDRLSHDAKSEKRGRTAALEGGALGWGGGAVNPPNRPPRARLARIHGGSNIVNAAEGVNAWEFGHGFEERDLLGCGARRCGSGRSKSRRH